MTPIPAASMMKVSLVNFIILLFFFSFEGKMERFPPRLKMKTLFLGVRYALICGRLELTRWLSLLFSLSPMARIQRGKLTVWR